MRDACIVDVKNEPSGKLKGVDISFAREIDTRPKLESRKRFSLGERPTATQQRPPDPMLYRGIMRYSFSDTVQ